MTNMHPEITYRLALLRVEEDARRLRTPRRPGRVASWRRRRHGPPAVAAAPPVELVPLPPPRRGREPTDRRVA